MTISNGTLVRRNADLIEAPVGDELMAIFPETGMIYGFNEPAAMIWAAIEAPATISQIVEQLSKVYDVDPALCVRDTIELLKELERDSIVKLEPA